MKFKLTEVLPWHSDLLGRLSSLADRGRLPNAIALTCPSGWGHESLLIHASLSLLEHTSSVVIDEFAHPDFRWIAPEGAVIKIDQIRNLNEFSVKTAQIAPRKIAAIFNAHLLNGNAANALLKTLEEPPPNTHVLLATPFWGKLLPTIRSRCQRYHVRADHDLAKTWLQTKDVDISESSYAEIGYAPLTAFDHAEQDVVDLTLWLTALTPATVSTAVEQVLKTDVVAWLGRWYRRLIHHMTANPIPNCMASNRSLIAYADELLDVRRQIEMSNAANTKLLLEHLLVRWLQLQRRTAR